MSDHAAIYKEAISAKVIRKALRSRQLRNLAARGMSYLRDPAADALGAGQALSRTPIHRQLIQAYKGTAPRPVPPSGRADALQFQRVLGRLANRQETPVPGLVARLKYALGSGERPGVLSGAARTGLTRMERLRGALRAGRGNLALITKDQGGKSVPNRERMLKLKEMQNRLYGESSSVFRSPSGHELALTDRAGPVPGVMNVDSIRHTDFWDLSEPLDLQRLRSALVGKGADQHLARLGALPSEALAKVKANPLLMGNRALKSVPGRAETGVGDLMTRLQTAKNTLPRSFMLTTDPGHETVRNLYSGAGFIPLRSGAMVLPGGSYKVPGTKLDLAKAYQGKRLINTAPAALLQRHGIDPSSATVKNMVRHPRRFTADVHRLRRGQVGDAKSRRMAEALGLATGEESAKVTPGMTRLLDLLGADNVRGALKAQNSIKKLPALDRDGPLGALDLAFEPGLDTVRRYGRYAADNAQYAAERGRQGISTLLSSLRQNAPA